jgi:carboxyl-terminal processing protease
MSKVRKFGALILDLRGNGGGAVKTLERLTGHFFDRDLQIAELKGRKKMDPQKAKTRGGDTFKGDLIVLVDSESGSAAEIFARVIQLEKRGIVIGDRTAGAVMQSQHHGHEVGAMTVIPYGASITNADVIMSDGNSLEGVGMTPDEESLPTADDLASGHDPVLARAAELLGQEITAEQAGSFFPIEWRD